MKTQRFILVFLTLVPAASTPAADNLPPTAQQQRGNASEWNELFGGAALPAVWQSAAAASDQIGAALAAKKMEGVAGWAETVHLASHALNDQVKLDDAERAQRLRGALGQAAKIADDVVVGANHHDFDETAEAFRRLKSALVVVRARLPKDVVDAPAQAVRFNGQRSRP